MPRKKKTPLPQKKDKEINGGCSSSDNSAAADDRVTKGANVEATLEEAGRSGSIDSYRKYSRSSSFINDLRAKRASMNLTALNYDATIENELKETAKSAAPNKPSRKLHQRRKRLQAPGTETGEWVLPVEETVVQGDSKNSEDSVSNGRIFTVAEAEDYERDDRLDPSLPLPEPTCEAKYADDFKSDDVVQVKEDTRLFIPLEIPVDNEGDILQAIAETEQKSSNSEMVIFNAILPISVIAALNMPKLRDKNSSLVPPVLLTVPIIRILSAFVTDVVDIGSTLVSMIIPEIRALLDSSMSKSYHSEPFTIWTSADHDYRYKAKVLTYVSTAHLSIGFALMKGDYDDKIPWPFDKMVAFKLVNKDDRMSRKRGFLCNVHSVNFTQSLARPTSHSNPPMGILEFISTQELDDSFTGGDSLTVIARFTSKNYVPSSDVKLELPNILRHQ